MNNRKKNNKSKRRMSIIIYSTVALTAIIFAVGSISLNNNNELSHNASAIEQHQQLTKSQNETKGKTLSMEEIMREIKPIHPKVFVQKNNETTSINGTIPLVQVAKTTNSTTIVRVNNTRGPDHKEVYGNEGNVELSIRHGISANTTNSTASSTTNTTIHIIEATVKNTGTKPIFLYAFRIFGQTPSGYQALSAEVLESDYSKDLWGPGLPIPLLTERIRLDSGESLSALFNGNWKVEPINETINQFSIAVQYAETSGPPAYQPTQVWWIGEKYFISPP
jgi:co-chaperonin GroES (HSP10)